MPQHVTEASLMLSRKLVPIQAGTTAGGFCFFQRTKNRIHGAHPPAVPDPPSLLITRTNSGNSKLKSHWCIKIVWGQAPTSRFGTCSFGESRTIGVTPLEPESHTERWRISGQKTPLLPLANLYQMRRLSAYVCLRSLIFVNYPYHPEKYKCGVYPLPNVFVSSPFIGVIITTPKERCLMASQF